MTLIFVIIFIGAAAWWTWVALGKSDRLADPVNERAMYRDGNGFDVVFRGYRMEEVDLTIAQLQRELARARAKK